MPLIAPDILAEARGLSLPLGATGLGVGALLWGLGWRFHRFWVVLAITVIAGLIGLSGHTVIGPRMLAAGLLFAIGAGLMALELSRLLAFAAAGLAVWLVVHRVLPRFDEPLICFLLGGVLGLLLYRVQLMALTSMVGTLLAGHSLLLIGEKILGTRFNASLWAQAHSLGLNITTLAVAAAGIAVQGKIERWREGKEGEPARSWFATFFKEPTPSPQPQPEHVVSATSKQLGAFASLFRRNP